MIFLITFLKSPCLQDLVFLYYKCSIHTQIYHNYQTNNNITVIKPLKNIFLYLSLANYPIVHITAFSKFKEISWIFNSKSCRSFRIELKSGQWNPSKLEVGGKVESGDILKFNQPMKIMTNSSVFIYFLQKRMAKYCCIIRY